MQKCINCGKYLQCCKSNPEITKITVVNCNKFIKKEDAVNKFLKRIIIFSGIAFAGAIGSIILEYIATNGLADFLASIGAVLVYLFMLIFGGLCFGFIINVITYINKKVQ
mgnify:CR=1 FL=1